MSKSETQYALYEIPTSSEPDADGHLPTSLISTSFPIPSWLCGNSTFTGSGMFVIYYSVIFYSCASSALYQNNFEIPSTRVRGMQNHGYVILSTEGTQKNHLYIRTSQSRVQAGKILIAKLSFHDEKSVIE